MTVMTLAPNASSSSALDCIAAASRHMYDAEVALHAARQSNVAAWIEAAYEKLHAALAERTAALYLSAVAAHAPAAWNPTRLTNSRLLQWRAS